MSKFIDLTGEKFGRLTVVQRSGSNKRGNALWLCLCKCGTEKLIPSNQLISKSTISCGCFNKEKSTTHGHYRNNIESITHISWHHMIDRCQNNKHPAYNRYGGRNIKVCNRWKKFENFLKDMGKRPTLDYSIDRINNDEGYCKSNCRWATIVEQARNRNNNHLVSYKNKTQCVSAWAEEFGIDYARLHQRLFRWHWSIHRALTTPVARRIKRNEHNSSKNPSSK